MRFIIILIINVIFISLFHLNINNKVEITKPQIDNYLTDKSIKSIAVENNYIWAGTSKGLYLINIENGEITLYDTTNSELGNNSIHDIVIDKKGNKWISTWYGGVSYYDNNNWITYNKQNSNLTSDNIEHLALDTAGNIWATSMDFSVSNLNSGGVSFFNGVEWKQYNSNNSILTKNGWISAIYVDVKNNVYIGLETEAQEDCCSDINAGLIKISKNQWKIYQTTNTTGINSNCINVITGSKTGVIWVSTVYKGISKYQNNKWTNYNYENTDMSRNNIIAMKVDEQNNLWCSFEEFTDDFAGVAKFDGSKWTKFDKTNSNLLSTMIYDIEIDSFGNVWFATSKGVAVFRNN